MEKTRQTESAPQQTMGKLCAVVRRSGYRRDSVVYIGWTEGDERPFATDELNFLGSDARLNVERYVRVGGKLPEVDTGDIIPVQYEVFDEPINFENTGRAIVRDLLSFYVRDDDNLLAQIPYIKGTKNLKDIEIDELTLLEAILDIPEPWQDTSNSISLATIQAKKMYTLFLPYGDTGTKLALLYKSTIDNRSNEEVLKLFIVDTIGQLFLLERTEKGGVQKGYLPAAQRYFERKVQGEKLPSAGIFDIILLFRDMGLLSIDDEWFQDLASQKGFTDRTGFILGSLAIGMGVLEKTSDGEQSLQSPLAFAQYQDRISKLDLTALHGLVQELAITARRAFR